MPVTDVKTPPNSHAIPMPIIALSVSVVVCVCLEKTELSDLLTVLVELLQQMIPMTIQTSANKAKKVFTTVCAISRVLGFTYLISLYSIIILLMLFLVGDLWVYYNIFNAGTSDKI